MLLSLRAASSPPPRMNSTYAAELFAIKPGSVSFADIDHHSRTTRKVDPIHELLAFGTRNVANLIESPTGLWAQVRQHPTPPPAVAISTNFFKCRHIDPESRAAFAFPNRNVLNSILLLHLHSATRALPRRQLRLNTEQPRCRTTTRTMFATQEHHPETRSASDGGESCAAVMARRIVSFSSRTTHRTVECLCSHSISFILLLKTGLSDVAGGILTPNSQLVSGNF